MPVSYDLNLVTLSVVIAILAAYTALDLTERIATAKGWAWMGWLIGGTSAFGVGIWSMHFVGMLAFHLPVPIHYHATTVIVSVIPALLSSGLALWLSNRQTLTLLSLVGASLLMGAGITTMHYTGMAAVRLPAIAHYNPQCVALSAAIAIFVSFVALIVIHYLRHQKQVIWWQKLGAATLMGIAVPIMHYTGMAAVCFSPLESWVADAGSFNTTWLSSSISAVTFTISGLALLVSSETKVIDRTKELALALEQVQQSQFQLIQSEKMSSLGQLVAGIAHEINNPANFINGNLKHVQEYTESLLDLVQLYQKYHPNPPSEIQARTEALDLKFVLKDLPKILDSMHLGTNRIRNIVLALRIFSRLDESELKSVNIHEGIDSALLILHHRLENSSDHPAIKVIKTYGDLPAVECYAGQLNQVFMNVLANAIDAIEALYSKQTFHGVMNYRGCITIQTAMLDQQQVQIKVIDNGIGIPESIKKQVFDPFFTTKPVGKGTGIGLFTSYQVITDKHQGKLEVRSHPDQGAEFIIQLPVKQSSPKVSLKAATVGV